MQAKYQKRNISTTSKRTCLEMTLINDARSALRQKPLEKLCTQLGQPVDEDPINCQRIKSSQIPQNTDNDQNSNS